MIEFRGPLFDTPAEQAPPLARRVLEAPPKDSQRRREQASSFEPTEVIVGQARFAHVTVADSWSYGVLQLACSFLPGRDTSISWARYRVQLLATAEQPAPLAVDLAPEDITERTEHDLDVTVEPKVEFASTSVSLGSLRTRVQRIRAVPRLISAGLQTSTVYWQMECTDQDPIVGSRGFYALLEGTPGSSFTVRSGLVADITTAGSTFRMATRQRTTADHIEQTFQFPT